MRHIRDQFGLHPLTLDLLFDRFLKTILDFVKLLLVGLKNAEIFVKCIVQLPFRDGTGGG